MKEFAKIAGIALAIEVALILGIFASLSMRYPNRKQMMEQDIQYMLTADLPPTFGEVSGAGTYNWWK